jgi:SAM-dependent methyltransferase
MIPVVGIGTPAILPPAGMAAMPEFDRGWVISGSAREPYLGYVQTDPSLNWSDELEELHEEASRTHFIDQWTRQAILARLGPLPDAPCVADVGCSTGFLLEDLRDARPDAELIGVDLLAAGLRKAHELVPEARLLHADACSLPLADASVDAVVSANLLEHIVDDRCALREIARVLKPGARAVIVVPAGPRAFDYYDRFLGHERRYARRELARKGRDVRLEVLEDFFLASLIYPAFWIVKTRNRVRFGHLEGEALAARVAHDITSTRDSLIGRALWRLEELIGSAGVRAPWGIRSLTVFRRPERVE